MSQNRNTHTQVRLSTKSGPLAQIWLASNLNSINRNIAKTNIVESVEEIARAAGVNLVDESVEPMTLRASGELLHGVVKVYSQKAVYLLTDISDLLSKVKSIFKGNLNKNTVIQIDTVAKLDQLLLQDAVTELDVLEVPSLDFLRDVQVPTELLIAERSMERQVQGAAPVDSVLAAQQQAWDMSLEVGRKFVGGEDDDLSHIDEESSKLKLDFDLGDSNMGTNTKSWGEGTRVTSREEYLGDGDATIRNNDDDDDELLPVNDDWDLGLNDDDQNTSGNFSVHGSDHSVEVGRRADDNHSLHEDTHLDFDLGLPKDLDEGEEYQEPTTERVAERAPRKRAPRNAALANVKRIITDEESEFKDEQVKNGPSAAIINDTHHEQGPSSRLKRSLESLYSEYDFLPSKIVSSFFDFTKLKKPRVLSQSHHVEESDISMDISLGLDGSLLHNSDPYDHQQADFDMNSDAPFPADEDPRMSDVQGSMNTEDYSGIQQDEFMLEGSVDREKTEKVELNTGEAVSKATVEMANLLRDEMTSGETTFDEILKSKHKNDAFISKGMASSAFFELLSLATTDCISLNQQEPFGTITILGKPSLYEKFVTA